MEQGPVYPIGVEQAVEDSARLTLAIRKKLHTLIQYYIYPEPTPNAIKDIEPRLEALEGRLLQLSHLKPERLAIIIDDTDALMASFVNMIIDQLINATHGVTTIFENHYDRALEERKPFDTIYKTLELRETQLKEIVQIQMTRPGRHFAEDHPQTLRKVQNHRPLYSANHHDTTISSELFFCRGAVQMINRRDRGKLCFIERHELNEQNQATLTALGGAFLGWNCPECSFKLQFHVSNSSTSNIHTTDECKTDPSGNLEYRSLHLVKCHLYRPDFGSTDHANPNHNYNTVTFEQSTSRPRTRSHPRPNLTRPRSSFSQSQTQPHLSPILRTHSHSYSQSHSHASIPKFGCIFCFSTGHDLSLHYETAFTTETHLAAHLAKIHREEMFSGLMMQTMCVGVDGKKSDRVLKWDLNFRS